jgi:hypothetical protein
MEVIVATSTQLGSLAKSCEEGISMERLEITTKSCFFYVLQ